MTESMFLTASSIVATGGSNISIDRGGEKLAMASASVIYLPRLDDLHPQRPVLCLIHNFNWNPARVQCSELTKGHQKDYRSFLITLTKMITNFNSQARLFRPDACGGPGSSVSLYMRRVRTAYCAIVEHFTSLYKYM